MQVGLHGRVRLAVPDDAGFDRLPEVLDGVLTCGGAVADGLSAARGAPVGTRAPRPSAPSLGP
jgi:hypothetical protein